MTVRDARKESEMDGADSVIAVFADHLGAAPYGTGIPKDSAITSKIGVKADGFLVMADGSSADTARAKEIQRQAKPPGIDLHPTKAHDDILLMRATNIQ
jgi:hypothetical protein